MKLKLLLFMGVFSALSSALSARDKVLSFLPPPNTPPTIVLATGQASELRYCPGSPIANIEIVIDDSETLFKDLVVTFTSSNQAYIADSEIAAYPNPATFVTNGQRYLGITGTIIPPVFVNGFTDITITVTDGDGSTATQVVKIFIEDLSIPTIFKTFTGPIASGAIDKTLSSSNCNYELEGFTGNVTVSDDCTDTPDIVVTQVATLNSITYNIGDTIPGQDGDVVLVTLTAEDLVGKTATTTFTITLQDETKPELTIILPVVNENLTVDATDCKFTIKDYTQGAFANVSLLEACTPGATITQSPAAGTVVDYFETNQEQTITFNCTDEAGNIADEVSFTVKVKDNTNPVAKSLAAKTVNLSSTINGGKYTFTGAELNNGSTDNCQIVSYTYLPAFVECDKAGTTVSVTMTVTDLSGNTATSSTDVTVLDVTPPVITVADIEIGTPTCLTLLTTDPKIAVESNLTDNCTVLPTTLIGTRSDGLDLFADKYPFGETTITWTVQDSFGNGATVTQKVTMNDNAFPEFVDAVSGVLTAYTEGQDFFNLSYDSLKDVGSTDVYPAAMLLKPTVNDATDYSLCPPIVNDIPVPVPTPEFLHLGKNTVIWTATDLYGTIVSATQEVTIEDTTIPVITLKNVIPPFQLDPNGQVVIKPADLDNGTIDGFNGNALKLTVVPNTFGCEFVGQDVSVTFFAEDYVGGLVVPDANGVVGDVSHKVYQQITVRIEDTEKPTITTSPVVVNTNSACTWNGTLALPTTADNCTVASVTSDKAADFAYPVGVTTVNWTVTDAAGNIATATQTVTVNDVEKPVIVSNGDKFVNSDAGLCGAVVAVSASATDNCTIGALTGIRDDSKLLTDVYPVGTTTITWNVTDANSNAALAVIQKVVVRDTQIPVITAAAVKLDNTTTVDQCGWTPTLLEVPSATAADNCTVGSPIGTRSDDLALSALYPIGTTTITWNVTDANGNVGIPTTTTVKVKDDQKPVITANGNKVVDNDFGVCGAVVSVSATASDNCTVGLPIGVRNDGKALTEVYPIGTTTISWTVTDVNGNAALAVTQTVKVTDIQKPVITANGDKEVNVLPGQCGSIVTVSATATDNCTVGSPTGVRSDSKGLTEVYPVGTTTITWNVIDANSNAAVAVLQKVVVTDAQFPVIAAAVTLDKTTTVGQCGWTPTLLEVPSATATDNCTVGTPTGKRSDNLALNAQYPLGTTTITWTVTDINGKVAYPATTTVIVKDVTGPTVVVKNIELVLYSGSVTIKPTDVLVSATDACGVNIMSYSLDKSTFTIADVSTSPITVFLTVKDKYDNPTVSPVIVTFPIQIVTTQVLTPNGDGINDTWIVENITNNPNSVVRVFNRWGSLVYSAKNYQNDWDGKLNGSDVTVPDGGSYYYQIDLNGTGNVDSEGWLYISRQ